MKLARLDSDIGRAQNAYDVFVALDDADRRGQECSIVPAQRPTIFCPIVRLRIFIDLDGELRSMDMLLGAALASAGGASAPIPSWRRACMRAVRPMTTARLIRRAENLRLPRGRSRGRHD